MEERVHVITAGSRPVYEVVESADRLTVTIRQAENREKKIDVISSVVPTLIKVLQEVKP